MQVFGHRGVQQGLLGALVKRRAVLRHEGDAEALHQREPQGEHHRELKEYLHGAQPPLHRGAQALLRNPQLRLLRLRVYPSPHSDCPGG